MLIGRSLGGSTVQSVKRPFAELDAHNGLSSLKTRGCRRQRRRDRTVNGLLGHQAGSHTSCLFTAGVLMRETTNVGLCCGTGGMGSAVEQVHQAPCETWCSRSIVMWLTLVLLHLIGCMAGFCRSMYTSNCKREGCPNMVRRTQRFP